MNEPFAAAATAVPLMIAGAGTAAAADRAAAVFDRVDRDGNGRVARAETDPAGDARFDRMNANANGQLNLGEMVRQARGRMERRLAKRFERLDANGDGAVARAGFADGAARRFDGDGDGAVTREEVQGRIRRGG